MKTPHRVVSVALGMVLAVGVIAVAVDVTTIRVGPNLPFPSRVTQIAFPGELINIQLGPFMTAPVSSDPDLVRPMTVTAQPSRGLFIAAKPGHATLHAISIPCPGCLVATILWRLTVDVRIPGT